MKNKKAIFIHVPRTGGNSIERMFRNYLLTYKHTPAGMVSRAKPDQWRDHWSFSVVRNPWDRVASYFYLQFNYEEQYPGFKEDLDWQREAFHNWIRDDKPKGYKWIAANCPRNIIAGFDGAALPDTVFRFEDTTLTHRTLNLLFGTDKPSLHAKASKRRNHTYRELIVDPKDIDIIAEVGAWEIEMYGYKFDE